MRERVTRRRVLTSAAAATAGLAGCLDAPTRAELADAETNGTDSAGDRTSDIETVSTDDVAGQYAEAYETAIPAVTLVLAAGESPLEDGSGTGFLIDDEYLLTNDHVIEFTDDIEVQFADEEWSEATVLGSDPYSDLAVLEVEDVPAYAEPLSFANERPAIGEEVVAIGNPFGLAASASRGIVSGVGRSLPSPTGFSIPDAIQTDAAVNPGNSGGPLVDLDGDPLGVVFAAGGEGIGFAISATLAERVVPALIDDGEFDHSYLGVRLDEVTPRIADANDLDEVSGVIVVDTPDDGPSDDVLEGSDEEQIDGRTVPVGGDVIVGIDDEEIPNQDALSTYLALETDPGDDVEVTVIRDGERESVTVTLDERPEPEDPF